VNGACLTVTKFDAQQNGGWFEVWLANETLERTDLGNANVSIGGTQSLTRVSGERRVGDKLNLERAMSAHSRFGGHFVQVS
jgi:riboflavin synthase